MAQGTLPPVFALPAGLGDMAVGVAALLLGRRWTPRRAFWFNVFGLADVVVAVTPGLLGGLATHPVLAVSPSTAAMSPLPLALIPTTVVPLDAALHVLSLARRRFAIRTATAPAATSRSRTTP
ncbi:hypothetical protein [Amycolatopsis sp. NPDC021455]|uniref:hypothetical protein n=1 Tax=Amycolatopsis sp. NPDC021455 TaxID=3154901 RepID=UPI003409E86C